MFRNKLLVILMGMVLLVVLAFSGASSSHAFAASKATTTQTKISTMLSCPTLHQGSSGSTVRTLQRKLNSLYDNLSDPRFFENSPNNFSPPLTVDGSFGSKTFNAVIDYQTWNGLHVDGIVGPATWGSLGGC